MACPINYENISCQTCNFYPNIKEVRDGQNAFDLCARYVKAHLRSKGHKKKQQAYDDRRSRINAEYEKENAYYDMLRECMALKE